MDPLFTIAQKKSFTVVTLTAESLMSAAILKELGPQLYRLIDEENHTKLILDLGRVRDVSSQFIGIIIAMHTKASKRRGRLVLVGLHDKLSELMQLTRLDRVITIVPTVQDALERDWVLG